MAEIRVERTSSKGWLWALLALAALAAAAWWFAANVRGGSGRAAAGGLAGGEVALAPAGGAAAGAPVARFLAWADSTQAHTDAGPDHRFVATGIERLSGAIGDLAARDSVAGSTVAEQVQALNRLAVEVTEDRAALTHADLVSAAFQSGAKLLGDLQQRRFPAAADAVADVRTAAAAVNKDRPLLEQKSQLEQFFTRAAAAVRAMDT